MGSNEIAFIRNGHLWTIDPDGANAFEVVAEQADVVGYSWSPNHQLLVFRTLDAQFAKTTGAKQLNSQPVTRQIGDEPSTLNTIGIDGGSPIPIMFSTADTAYSNPIWNATGTRLIYRQEPLASPRSPNNVFWWVSQNDQPGGIAAKNLPSTNSIPSLSYIDSSAIGNTAKGIFSATLNGTATHYLLNGPLAGHPLPAALERVLWQPAHPRPDMLYAITTPRSAGKETQRPSVQLILRNSNSDTRGVATCTCTQFAWSPDGNAILYAVGSTYTIFHLNDSSSSDMTLEDGSIPYWSPDSRFLLFDGPHKLQLVHVADTQVRPLLSDANPPASTGTPLIPDANALLQPVPDSLWAADSRHFVFMTRGRLQWQGKQLSSGNGIYTMTINDRGQPQDAPAMVDKGNDSQVGWTYQDANTSFLY